MIANPELTAPAGHRKDTLIPLVLALAIGVAGLVEPADTASRDASDPMPQFDPVGNAGLPSRKEITR